MHTRLIHVVLHSAHLIHNFGQQSLELPANDRVIAALGDIGPAVRRVVLGRCGQLGLLCLSHAVS